jgi:hypothetical protein
MKTTREHIILPSRQPVFAFIAYCCMLSGEVANCNSIVFIDANHYIMEDLWFNKGVHISSCLWFSLVGS